MKREDYKEEARQLIIYHARTALNNIEFVSDEFDQEILEKELKTQLARLMKFYRYEPVNLAGH